MLTALSAQWGHREPAASPRGMGPSVRPWLPGVWVLALSPTSCVMLGTVLPSALPQFPPLQHRATISTSWS